MHMEGPNAREEVGAAVHNRRILNRLGLFAAVSFLFASFAPLPLVAPMLSLFLMLSATLVAAIAALTVDRVWAPHLNRWDLAAMLFGLALLSGLFTDPEVVSTQYATAPSP